VRQRIGALQQREQELLRSIDEMAMVKKQVLDAQLTEIMRGTCPPAAAETVDGEVDHDRFLVNADAVIAFRIGEEDFLDKINTFGAIGEDSAYASLSYAKGPALGVLKVDNPSYLWVYACDRNGHRRKDGGNLITPTVSNPECFQSMDVEDLKDGRYKIKFVPRAKGTFMLDIAINSEDCDETIYGSPFQLTVRQQTDYQAIGVNDVMGKVTIGASGDAHSVNALGTIHHPSGIDFDASGRFVFVADQSNSRVQVFEYETGQPVCAFGKNGFGSADFDTPCDIVVDRDNRVVVSDLLNHRLQVLEFNPREVTLKHVRCVGLQGFGYGQFQFPKGLTIQENGHLVVCDSGNHRVQVLDVLNNFSFVRQYGTQGEGKGQFVSPLDVAVNTQGEILVSDSTNRIQVFNVEGEFLRCFGGSSKAQRAKGLPTNGYFNYPTNMAVNDENVLFVSDQGNSRVQVLNATDGTFMHRWGGSKKKAGAPGGEDAGAETEPDDPDRPPEWVGIKKPTGIAVNTHGSIVVADYHWNTVFAF